MKPPKERLTGKLRVRLDRPGFSENVKAIETAMEGLETGFRDKQTGKFVAVDHALANPDSTEPV